MMIYAEDVKTYWMTSKTSPDTWMERTRKEIASIKGKLLTEAYGMDATGRAAFMLTFAIGEDVFKVIWPVLQSRTGKSSAAKIQAATMMYHDVKAKCVTAKVMGARATFLPYLVLADGRTASEATTPELQAALPRMLTSGGSGKP